MKVKEIMVQPAIVAEEDTTLEEIARMMLDNRIGCVPVVDGKGKLTGIITESDFLAEEHSVPFSTFQAPQLFGRWLPKEGIEEIYKAARTITAKEIMTSPVVTVSEDDPIEEAVRKLLSHDINHVPVVREGFPVGIVARHDLLNLMIQNKHPK
ncbi:MAG TPA: CBS domain-containing protein [Thermodesulfobacteriota bacterium]|nr:CBS domain-containing protein [Thermodesulfobacteriota bacterium]